MTGIGLYGISKEGGAFLAANERFLRKTMFELVLDEYVVQQAHGAFSADGACAQAGAKMEII